MPCKHLCRICSRRKNTIGNNMKISANSFVKTNVPDNSQVYIPKKEMHETKD